MEERYKFRSRARKADESIDAYLTIFRELAKSCDFGDLEKEMIRDQIVEKCSSHILKQRLLQQGDLFLAKTVKIAHNAETAVKKRDYSPKVPKGTQSPLTTCVPLAEHQRNALTVTVVVARTVTAQVSRWCAKINLQ